MRVTLDPTRDKGERASAHVEHVGETQHAQSHVRAAAPNRAVAGPVTTQAKKPGLAQGATAPAKFRSTWVVMLANKPIYKT